MSKPIESAESLCSYAHTLVTTRRGHDLFNAIKEHDNAVRLALLDEIGANEHGLFVGYDVAKAKYSKPQP